MKMTTEQQRRILEHAIAAHEALLAILDAEIAFNEARIKNLSHERWRFSSPDQDGNYTVLKVEKF